MCDLCSNEGLCLCVMVQKGNKKKRKKRHRITSHDGRICCTTTGPKSSGSQRKSTVDPIIWPELNSIIRRCYIMLITILRTPHLQLRSNKACTPAADQKFHSPSFFWIDMSIGGRKGKSCSRYKPVHATSRKNPSASARQTKGLCEETRGIYQSDISPDTAPRTHKIISEIDG